MCLVIGCCVGLTCLVAASCVSESGCVRVGVSLVPKDPAAGTMGTGWGRGRGEQRGQTQAEGKETPVEQRGHHNLATIEKAGMLGGREREREAKRGGERETSWNVWL